MEVGEEDIFVAWKIITELVLGANASLLLPRPRKWLLYVLPRIQINAGKESELYID